MDEQSDNHPDLRSRKIEDCLRKLIMDRHASLRKSVQNKGDDNAELVWQSHLQDEKCLEEYAVAMYTLATKYWEDRNKNSRITWVYNEIQNYFRRGEMEKRTAKEARKVTYFPEFKDQFETSRPRAVNLDNGIRCKVLDVGSCYNPFGFFEDLDVTAIDLQPSVPEVLKCDFLSLQVQPHMENVGLTLGRNQESAHRAKRTNSPVSELEKKRFKRQKNDVSVDGNEEVSEYTTNGSDIVICDSSLTMIYGETFDAVVFCLFISYIPSPRLRFKCCQKAYDLLKPNGILIIITPDSKHSQANFHLVRLWKVTLQFIGFDRVKYAKEKHFHGFVFRKGLCRDIWKADAERNLIEMKAKRENIKLISRFRNFNYDSVIERIYIHQDLVPCEENIEELR